MLPSSIHTYLAAALLLACSSQDVSAQSFEQIFPEWEVNSLYGFLHWDGDTVYEYGNEHTLLRTTDAGDSWQQVFNSSNGRHIRRAVKLENDIFFTNILSLPEQLDSTNIHITRYNVYTNEESEIIIPRAGRTRYPDDNLYLQSTNGTLYLLEADDNSSALHCSSDAGETWQSFTLSDSIWVAVTNADPLTTEFHFIDNNVGLIFAGSPENKQGRFLFRTTDGGSHWERLEGEYERKFVHLQHVTDGSSTTVYLGVGLQVLRSTDLGATWQATSSIPWHSLNAPGVRSMSFAGGVGIVVGSQGDAYATTDGGENWAQVKEYWLIHGFYTNSVIAVNQQSILIGNEQGYIFRSTDGGITWDNKLFTGIIIGQLYFRDSQNGVMLGLNENLDIHTYRTSDQGATWKQVEYLSSPYGSSDIKVGVSAAVINGTDTAQFYNRGSTASGVKSTLHRLTNLGSTLTLLKEWGPGDGPAGTYSAIRNLHFVSSNSGTHASFDDGQTWEFFQYTDTLCTEAELHLILDDHDQLQVYCFNDYTRNGLFWYATVFRSVDSCRSWERISVPIDANARIQELDVIGVGDVIIRLSGGELRRTTDNGASWHILGTRDERGIGTYYFPPVAYRFESPSIRIEKTENLWTSSQRIMDFHGSYTTPFVYFLDVNHGWFTNGAAIYHTTNGGVNWVQLPGVVSDDAGISSVYPNPVGAGQSTVVDVTLPMATIMGAHRGAPLQVSVYDILGREVAVLYHGSADPGVRTLTWQPSATLPAGIYMVRMSLGEKVWAKRVAVVR